MKYLLICTTIIFLQSCTRNNEKPQSTQPTPPASVDSPKTSAPVAVLDSIIIYSLGPKEITYTTEKFKYDSKGRLIEIYEITADSISNPSFVDPLLETFSYSNNDSLPYMHSDSNRANYVFSPDGFYHHLLEFNSAGEITLDSETVTHNAEHYIYGNGSFEVLTSYGIDSFYFSGGNLTKYIYPFETHIYTYSTYPNPFYFRQFGSKIGKTLSPICLSRNLFSQIQNIFSADGYTVNYSWNVNADGQVVNGIGTDQASGLPIEYYWFVYKK